jgi:hypothetical protein
LSFCVISKQNFGAYKTHNLSLFLQGKTRESNICFHVDESSQVLITTLLSDSVNNVHFWLCLSIISIAITYASVRNYTYNNKGKPVGCYGRFREYCFKFYKLLSSEFHVSCNRWSCCILYSQRCLDQWLALHRDINDFGMMPNTKHFGEVTVTRSVDLLFIDSVNSYRKIQSCSRLGKLNINYLVLIKQSN